MENKGYIQSSSRNKKFITGMYCISVIDLYIPLQIQNLLIVAVTHCKKKKKTRAFGFTFIQCWLQQIDDVEWKVRLSTTIGIRLSYCIISGLERNSWKIFFNVSIQAECPFSRDAERRNLINEPVSGVHIKYQITRKKMLTCATRALTSPTADNSSKFNFVRSGGCTW